MTGLSLGTTYQSSIYMGKFSDYSGLLAGQGAFDIPANFGFGIGYQLTPEILLAADFERILYSGTQSIANPSTNQAPLGSNGGPGFGWSDVNAFRASIDYKATRRMSMGSRAA